MTIDQINKDQHCVMRTTKYLIPTLKPNQFDPIPITGHWEYLESKKRWICHDATPSPYRDMEINEIALVDNI